MVIVLVLATLLGALDGTRGSAARATVVASASRMSSPVPLAASNGTWVFRGPYPYVKERMGMAFDSAAGTTILFGGLYGLAFLNTTWAYNATSNEWTNVTPAVSPTARADPAMAYDSAAARTLLFGGASWQWTGGGGIQNLVEYNDLWVYDASANTWTERFPSPSPPAVNGAAMVYDTAADRLLLFGGYTGSTYINETWSYDYNTDTWTNMSPSLSPPARFGEPMSYDPTVDKVVMFGGRSASGSLPGDTWVFDYGTNAWTNVTSGTAPAGGYLMPMAFDPLLDESLLFGNGYGPSNETWAYNASLNAWLQLTPTASPPSGAGVMVWDEVVHAMVLHLLDNNYTGAGSGTWLYLASLTAPTAPDQLTALSSDGKVGLSWQPPAWDGGSPVTNYTVYRGTVPGGEGAIATLGNVTQYGDTNVTNGRTYYYQVSATNAIGESPRSAEVHAAPSSLPADMTPPTVIITTPADGATVDAGTVFIRGTAADNVAVTRVDLSSDGITWSPATGTTSWSGNLSLAAGPRTIYVQATDSSGNHAVAAIHVEVVAPGSATPTTVDYVPYIGVGVVVAIVIACVAVYAGRRRRTESARGREPPMP